MAGSVLDMLGRIGTRSILVVLVAMVIAGGCAGTGDDQITVATEIAVDTEPAQTTSAVPDGTSSTSSESADVTESAGTEQDLERPASVDEFLDSWDATASDFSENPGLAPTISAADVTADPTIGVDVFVEQVTPQTVIGGIVDPETGTVTGLMGLSEPDSDDAMVMVEIIWVGAFGADDRATMEEYFTVEEVRALPLGEQVTYIYRSRSVVMNHVDGAEPEDGLIIFTVGEEGLVEEDPSHDSIANTVLGLLVRTA